MVPLQTLIFRGLNIYGKGLGHRALTHHRAAKEVEKVCIYIYTTQSSFLLYFSAHSLFLLLPINHTTQLTSAAKFKMIPSINSVQPNNPKTIENDCLGKNRALTFISKAGKPLLPLPYHHRRCCRRPSEKKKGVWMFCRLPKKYQKMYGCYIHFRFSL